MLFLFEISKIDRRRWQSLFDIVLIESRSILGFIYRNGGTASGCKLYMRVSFLFKNNSLELNLRWGSSDFLVFEQIFIKEEYAQLFDNTLDSPVIVDAGANIGCTTIYLKTLYPSARILSIEADPANFDALNRNIRLCNLDKVTCLNSALWHVNGTARLARNFQGVRDWSIKVEESGDIIVPARTMSSILEQTSIGQVDVLKMDIEGAELNIFVSDLWMSEMLRTLRCIAIEVHDDEEKKIEAALSAAGFSVFKEGETLFGKKLTHVKDNAC